VFGNCVVRDTGPRTAGMVTVKVLWPFVGNWKVPRGIIDEMDKKELVGLTPIPCPPIVTLPGTESRKRGSTIGYSEEPGKSPASNPNGVHHCCTVQPVATQTGSGSESHAASTFGVSGPGWAGLNGAILVNDALPNFAAIASATQ
jgi:hypothetical protein